MMQTELGLPTELQHTELLAVKAEESLNLPLVATELALSGRRLDYLQVQLNQCLPGQRRELAHFLEEKLEKPIFEREYGPGVIDGEEEILETLNSPDALLLLAVERKPKREDSDAVGFLLGLPAKDYGLTYEDVTPEGNLPLPRLPDEHTYYLHTLGVLPEARNRKVGFNLWNIFRESIFNRLSKWESLAVLALMQKDGSSYMLRLFDRALDLERLRREGRVSEAIVRKFYSSDHLEVQDRLVPIHYLLIDLRGKFETALTVYP